MNTTKPLTICPLPPRETLELLRAMTTENDHSGARVVAARWLASAWEDQHGAPGNPFQPIVAGLEALRLSHERAGHLSPEMHTVRLYLWNLAAEIVAPACGLASAARELRHAL